MTLTRRALLASTAAATGAAAIPSLAASADAPATAMADKPLRVAHLTDMHVNAARNAADGFAAALKAAATYKPDLVITGGDHIMDALERDKADVQAQWKLYNKTLRENIGTLPVYPVLGNHDIWGWLKDAPADDPLFGKTLALGELGLKSAYYSFEIGAWRFVVLDSSTRRDNGYVAQLDAPQLKWLEAELARPAAGKHICIVTHIPVLAACVFFDGKDRLQKDFWHVPDAWMHRDAGELCKLFRAAGVKLAISGHIHLADRVDYNGVTYLCNGAVCGNWWRGAYHETPAGFAILDLYPDGRFRHEYVDLGWKPRA